MRMRRTALILAGVLLLYKALADSVRTGGSLMRSYLDLFCRAVAVVSVVDTVFHITVNMVDGLPVLFVVKHETSLLSF